MVCSHRLSVSVQTTVWIWHTAICDANFDCFDWGFGGRSGRRGLGPLSSLMVTCYRLPKVTVSLSQTVFAALQLITDRQTDSGGIGSSKRRHYALSATVPSKTIRYRTYETWNDRIVSDLSNVMFVLICSASIPLKTSSNIFIWMRSTCWCLTMYAPISQRDSSITSDWSHSRRTRKNTLDILAISELTSALNDRTGDMPQFTLYVCKPMAFVIVSVRV